MSQDFIIFTFNTETVTFKQRFLFIDFSRVELFNFNYNFNDVLKNKLQFNILFSTEFSP